MTTATLPQLIQPRTILQRLGVPPEPIPGSWPETCAAGGQRDLVQRPETGSGGVPVLSAIPLVSHTGVRRARWQGIKGLERLALRGLGDRAGLVSLVPTPAFRVQLAALAASRPAAIAVLGGDGTARTALEVLTPLGIPVIPLPGGTLNRLSRLVYGRASARTILQRVADAGRPQSLAGARLGPHRFFVACGFGAAMGFHGVREALRRGDLGAAVQAFRQAGRGLFAARVAVQEPGVAQGPTTAMQASIASAPVQMTVVAVGPIAPAFGVPAPSQPAPGHGGLEVVTARFEGWRALLGLAPHALTGSWAQLPSVTRAASDVVRLTAADGPDPVPGLLDGEPILLDSAAVIQFDPACGLVMAA